MDDENPPPPGNHTEDEPSKITDNIAETVNGIKETVNGIKETVNGMDPMSFWVSVSIIVIVVLVIAALFFITWEMLKDKVTRDDKNRDIIINEIANIRKIDGEKLITVSNDLPNEINAKIDEQKKLLVDQQDEIKTEISNKQEFSRIAFDKQEELTKKYYRYYIESQKKIQHELKELQQGYKIFQESLQTRDKEIERLKQGYDATIHEKCVGRFISLYVEMEKEIGKVKTPEHRDSCLHLIDTLTNALRENGVTVVYPEIDKEIDDYKDYIASITNNTKVDTDDPSRHKTIKEIISPAFVLQGQEKPKILQPAIVKYYAVSKELTTQSQQPNTQPQHLNKK